MRIQFNATDRSFVLLISNLIVIILNLQREQIILIVSHSASLRIHVLLNTSQLIMPLCVGYNVCIHKWLPAPQLLRYIFRFLCYECQDGNSKIESNEKIR